MLKKNKSCSIAIKNLEDFKNDGYAQFALFLNEDIKSKFSKCFSLYNDSIRTRYKSGDFNKARDETIKIMHADLNCENYIKQPLDEVLHDTQEITTQNK